MKGDLSFKEAMAVVFAGLKELELVAFHEKVYDNVPGEAGQTGIIVGYLPENAVILCVEIFQARTLIHVTFTLCGQLIFEGFPSTRLKVGEHEYLCQSESEEGNFIIQFVLGRYWPVATQIALGMKFFQDVFDLNKDIFAWRFKKTPSYLPILPVQTVAYQETVNGPIEAYYYDVYLKIIGPDLPPDIMPLKTPPAA